MFQTNAASAGPARRKTLADNATSARYWSDVRSKIYREVRYPAVARQRGVEGVAAFRISFDTNGNLVAVTDLTPDVDASLRQACATAIRRAAPFSPIRGPVASVAMTADVPVSFRLVD